MILLLNLFDNKTTVKKNDAGFPASFSNYHSQLKVERSILYNPSIALFRTTYSF